MSFVEAISHIREVFDGLVGKSSEGGATPLEWSELNVEVGECLSRIGQNHTELSISDFHKLVTIPLSEITHQGIPHLSQNSSRIESLKEQSSSASISYLIRQAVDDGLKVVKANLELQLLPSGDLEKSPVESVRSESDKKAYIQLLFDIARYTNSVAEDISNHFREETSQEVEDFKGLQRELKAIETSLYDQLQDLEIQGSSKTPEQLFEEALGNLPWF